jgi:hypothetical protein
MRRIKDRKMRTMTAKSRSEVFMGHPQDAQLGQSTEMKK